jgi:hypothetical protein
VGVRFVTKNCSFQGPGCTGGMFVREDAMSKQSLTALRPVQWVFERSPTKKAMDICAGVWRPSLAGSAGGCSVVPSPNLTIEAREYIVERSLRMWISTSRTRKGSTYIAVLPHNEADGMLC